MLHRLEVAEREGVRKRAVFAEALLVVASLHVVEAAGVAAVVSRINAPLAVDFDAERVAAPFGEDFVFPQPRMITPDQLTQAAGDFLVARFLNRPADRAALRSIEPAIGAPLQIADDRVGVFDAEALQVE